MVKIIMHGCNGHMGQVISGLVEKDPDAEIVAGIDVADQGKNSYPVYTNMEECQVEADALIDFSSAKATDALLAYCEKRKLPVVLCTTISRKLNVIVYETQQSADSDGLAFKQSIAKSKQCYVLLRIMRKIVKGKGKCDRQAVDAEFVIELDGEESKLFKEMFAELLK